MHESHLFTRFHTFLFRNPPQISGNSRLRVSHPVGVDDDSNAGMQLPGGVHGEDDHAVSDADGTDVRIHVARYYTLLFGVEYRADDDDEYFATPEGNLEVLEMLRAAAASRGFVCNSSTRSLLVFVFGIYRYLAFSMLDLSPLPLVVVCP